jgi:hypothetical protein
MSEAGPQQDRQASRHSRLPQSHRPGPFRTGALCRFADAKKVERRRNQFLAPHLSSPGSEGAMLVERGTQTLNVEVVSEAYAIAANYLRRSGALPDSLVTNDRLLRLIVVMFQHGEFNKIRLANKAIAQFEARAFA